MCQHFFCPLCALENAQHARELLAPKGWSLRIKTRSNNRKYAYASCRISREVEQERYVAPLDEMERITHHIAALPDYTHRRYTH